MKINILIRGHVRNSFDNDKFHLLIKEICDDFECDIYIHTWNVIQTSRSWRQIHDDRTVVDEEFLKKNLVDVWPRVKGLMIDDEESVVLHGNTEGNIGWTPCPVKGYKSMFYGKLRVSEYAFNHVAHDEIAVQTRFDVLANSFSISHEKIIDFIKNPPETTDRIKFIDSNPICGIENLYIARIYDMYNFIKYFYLNFDEIYTKHNRTIHQEFPVFFERNNF